MAIIAIEEHFTSPALRKLLPPKGGQIQAMLDDAANQCLKAMDEAGVDIAVLSENNPAAQNLEPGVSIKVARESNDFLHAMIQANPTRFAGFAALPLPDPKAAADELERGITRLGFKGAMIMGTTRGDFIDDKKYWPVFERAVALDVPVYLHPSPIKPAMLEGYFHGHALPMQNSPLGFGLETLVHSFRLISSGLFEHYPALKIIVGHLGETAPFTLWRTDHNVARAGLKLPKSFADYYRRHFWLTTSGAFSNSALACAIAEMGIERIMFAVDWPYIEQPLGTAWLKAAPIGDKDRAAIFEGNARKLLKV
jgi:2,3-dihydroxybenzoate decarboxylase